MIESDENLVKSPNWFTLDLIISCDNFAKSIIDIVLNVLEIHQQKAVQQFINFPDLWSLNHQLDEEVTLTVSFAVGCLKFDPQQWPQMTQDDLQSKIPEHPERNLWSRISSPKFLQNLLNYVDKEAFWAYLNNDPKRPVRWPLTTNSRISCEIPVFPV